MADAKAVQVRPEIKGLAQTMELRAREAAKKIASGDWQHYRLMSVAELLEGAQRNLDQLKETNLELTPEKARQAAADCANFVNFLRLRLAGK
jgi:uncharacterized protein YPO0396